jgi:hypothetical protein
MSLVIQWTDNDPVTGQRRYLHAERFAGVWHFKYRFQRRADWTTGLRPTREMWEHILDAVQRRSQRDDGAGPEDVAQIEQILAEYRDPPSFG